MFSLIVVAGYILFYIESASMLKVFAWVIFNYTHTYTYT